MERKRYPVQCNFELTPRCNFHCKMCYVRLDAQEIPTRGRELTTAEWIRLGEQAVDAGTFGVTLTGGEPLMRPDFAEIYEAYSEMGFWLTLQTNLSMLDEKTMALLEERPPKLIKSTLYGASDATYEKVCGVKDGLTKVRKGIELVQRADIPLMLVSTVIRDNAEDLNAIHQLAADYGLPLQHTHNVLDSRRNGNHESILSSRILYEDLTEEEKAEVHFKPHPAIQSPLDLCGTYQSGGYWVLWDGRMSICAHMKMDYQPLNSSIEQCFYTMQQDLEQQYATHSCSECGNNTYCRACPAALYVEQTEPGTEKCKSMHTRVVCEG